MIRFRVLLVALSVGWSLAPSCNTNAPVASVSGLGTLYDVAVDDTLAVTAAIDSGLTFVDLSNPHAPVVLGAFDLPDSEYAVDLADGLAYVLEARGLGGFLSVLDVTDPADPQVLYRELLPLPRTYGNLVVRGSHLYVATSEDGLLVFDVSVPSDPEIVGALPTGGKAAGVALSGDHAAVVVKGGDMLFADVSSPLAPSLLWNLPLGSEVAPAMLDDTLVVLRENWARLYDVSVASGPAYLSLAPTSANDSLLSGTDVYFGTDAGVSVYDMSDPSLPQLSGEVATAAPVAAIAQRDTMILAADSGGTLTVILSF